MKNEFSFYGIGQGLFYSGRLFDESFNFVYDCGTKSSDKSFINNTIGQLPPNLNFVVISHLHEDHVNGLPELLERVSVEKIFLPYFDVKAYRDVFIASLIAGDILPNTLTFNLILKLYDVTIDRNDGGLSRSCLEHIEHAKKVFLQDDSFSYDIHEKWCFRFYNRKIDDSCYIELQDKLQEILDGRSIDQYIDESKGDFKKLRSVFKKLHDNYNMTSLLLMHWNPLEPTKKTLLTGDIRFDEELERRVCAAIEENDRIILQVPHHGATTEWQSVPNLIDDRAIDIVLSFGLINGYHHPSIKKLMDYYDSPVLSKKIKFVFDGSSYRYFM